MPLQASMVHNINSNWHPQWKGNTRLITKAHRIIIKNIENNNRQVQIDGMGNKVRKTIIMTSFPTLISQKKNSECFTESSPLAMTWHLRLITSCNKRTCWNRKVIKKEMLIIVVVIQIKVIINIRLKIKF